MHVLTEVIGVLLRNLSDPKLPTPTAPELAVWLKHVSEDEIAAAMERILGDKKPRGTLIQFQRLGNK